MSSDRNGDDAPEPFPALSPVTEEAPKIQNNAAQEGQNLRRSSSTTNPNSPRRSRVASIRQSLIDSNPPLGAWQAIGQDTSKIPTLPEIKNGSYSADGWSHEGQLEKRNHNPHEIHKRRLSRSSQSQGSGNRSTRTNTANAHAVPEETEDIRELKNASQASKPQTEGLPKAHLAGTHLNEKSHNAKHTAIPLVQTTTDQSLRPSPSGPDETGTYPNGYRFPKKHTWKQSFAIFGKAFWKFFLTPTGFLITIYGLNVVAWGAMIFFLLIPGATPAMCKSYPDCNNKRYSARQIWIENTSQILNALFCVTGFGLFPWRARDFYFMIRNQVFHDHNAHRKLAGYYSGWYRLPGSDTLPEHLGPPPKPTKPNKNNEILDTEQANKIYTEEEITASHANPAIPLPPYRMAPAPLTGIRAAPTGFNKLAWMIWMYMWNTFFQCCLCFVMWHFTKYNRPSWATATFIVLGCGTGAAAGYITFTQGKKIKEIEGIPVKDYDVEESPEDFHERMEKRQKKIDKKNKRGKGSSEKQ